MRWLILGAWLAVLPTAASSAQAQDQLAAAPAAATPDASPAPPANVVPAGTPIMLELTEAVSTKTLKSGDMFPLRLALPIELDGRVIVPRGAPGEGQVVDAAPSGALGKPAKLVLAARYINVNGTRLNLRGFRMGGVGRDNSNAIMAASFVPYVGVLAMFAHGGQIEIPAGSLGQAKLVADLPAPPAPASAAGPQAPVQPAPPASAPSQ